MYRDRLQAAFDALQFDQPFRVILPDGSTATHGQGQPAFTIHIKTNRAARDIIIKSSLGFGEAYTRGEVDVEGDLQAVALLGYELQLRLQPGELVVEAGCGWGGLALHMVRNYGVRVKSFNISQEQIAFARERAQRLGIGSDRIEYVRDDYRNIPNHVKSCDKFASICMLEHVGRESYASFHHLVAKVLRKPGLAMLQFISRANPSPISNPCLE